MMNLLKSQGAAACLALSSLVLLVALARVLEPHTFAYYSIVVAYTAAFAKIAGLNVYFFYRHQLVLASSRERTAIFRSYATPVLVFGLLSVIGLATVGITLRKPEWMESPLEVLLLAALALVSLRNLEVVRFYHATAKFTFATLAQAGVKLITIAFVAVAAAYGFSLDRTALLIVLTLSAASFPVAQAVWDRDFFSTTSQSNIAFDRKSLALGFGLLAPVLFGEALVVADRSFLAAWTDAVTVAQYSLASQGIFIAYGILGGSLVSYYYPHIAQSYHSGNVVSARATCFRALGTGIGSSLVVPLAVWLTEPVVPMLLGSQYRITGDILLAMSLLPLLMFLSSSAVHALYLLERVSISLWIHGVALVFHVAATYLLTSSLGVSGAIAALYASLTFTTIAHVIVLILQLPRRPNC